MENGLLAIQNIEAAKVLQLLEPIDDSDRNGTVSLFVDENDGWKLKILIYDSTAPDDERVITLSVGELGVDIPVGQALFVNTLGNDTTGARESLVNQYATPNGAFNAAQDGDTIYVFGGTYSVTSNLVDPARPNIKWRTIGDAEAFFNVFATDCFCDNGIASVIDVKGNFRLQQFFSGNVIEGSHPSTVINLEVLSAQGLGGAVVRCEDGSGVITVRDFMLNTQVNTTLRFNGGASYTVNCPNILNNAFIGLGNAILVKEFYTGTSTVNCVKAENQTNPTAPTVVMQRFNYTGTLTVNASDGIYWLQAAPGGFQANSAVLSMGGNLIVNADIYAGAGKAIDNGFPEVKTLVHNGNATNTGTLVLVDCAANTDNSTVTLNGSYESDSAYTVRARGANSKFTIKGRYLNKSVAGVTKNCVLVEDNMGTVIFDQNPILIFQTPAADTLCIGANVAKNVKFFTNVGSNLSADANITNLIGANSLIVDTDYEF